MHIQKALVHSFLLGFFFSKEDSFVFSHLNYQTEMMDFTSPNSLLDFPLSSATGSSSSSAALMAHKERSSSFSSFSNASCSPTVYDASLTWPAGTGFTSHSNSSSSSLTNAAVSFNLQNHFHSSNSSSPAQHNGLMNFNHSSNSKPIPPFF